MGGKVVLQSLECRDRVWQMVQYAAAINIIE
jgi:hypothetical protein